MRKNEFKFTQAKIKNLPLPANGRVDYHDEDIKKLSCRVSSTDQVQTHLRHTSVKTR